MLSTPQDYEAETINNTAKNIDRVRKAAAAFVRGSEGAFAPVEEVH